MGESVIINGSIRFQLVDTDFSILARERAVVLYDGILCQDEEHYIALQKLEPKYRGIDSEYINGRKGGKFFTFDLYDEDGIKYLVSHHQDYIKDNYNILKYYCLKNNYRLMTYYFHSDYNYQFYQVLSCEK